jgi:hypothetical protein
MTDDRTQPNQHWEILGMLFGIGACISSQIVNEVIWQVKYPNGWVEKNKMAGNRLVQAIGGSSRSANAFT